MARRVFVLTVQGALLAFVVVLFSETLSISPPANVFPVVLLSATALLLAVALIQAIAALFRGHSDSALFESGRGRVVAVTATGMTAYAWLMPFGYLPVTFAFLFLAYLFLAEKLSPRTLVTTAVMSACVSGLTYLVFALVLGVNLPG